MLIKAKNQEPSTKSQKARPSLLETKFFLILKPLLPIVYCLLPIYTNAQCAMCRAAIESEGNGVKAEAINDGIVYLMVIPYLLVGGIGYAVYRMKTKK